MQRGTLKQWMIQRGVTNLLDPEASGWFDHCSLWFEDGGPPEDFATFEEACARLMQFTVQGAKLRLRPKVTNSFLYE